MAGGVALVAALTALTVSVLALPAQACACGALLLPGEQEATVTGESAIVAWDGQEERIILSIDVHSGAESAALLIPTPSPAAVSLADPGSLAEVTEFTAPLVREVDQWWPEWLTREDHTEVGERDLAYRPRPLVPLEGLDVDVVPAADAGELEAWLDANDYVLRDDIVEALTPYIQQEWHFVLIRLDAEDFDGRLQPLDIRFASNQLVYPMRLSVAGGPLHVRTFVFADHRMERADSMGGELTWAGPVRPSDFVNKTLVDIAAGHQYLTAWEQTFTSPRNQVDGDMIFAAASTDAPFERVYTRVNSRQLLGAPAGPTLVFGGLILVGFGGGVISMTRRRRDREANSDWRA